MEDLMLKVKLTEWCAKLAKYIFICAPPGLILRDGSNIVLVKKDKAKQTTFRLRE